MILRLIAMAIFAAALTCPALAETQDLAPIAKASGTPDIPGLKVVWLAPWGEVAGPSVAQHHRASDRRAVRLRAARSIGASQESGAARRHGLGRNRRHGILGGAGNARHAAWRRRQSQRQQVHRQ